MAAGLSTLQVQVDQVIPSRAIAVCKEVTTGKSIEVRLLPLRAGRLPAVSEQWLLDRTYGAWTFAALVGSPTLFPAPLSIQEEAPEAPKIGDRWAPVAVQVWNGTDWVDEA